MGITTTYLPDDSLSIGYAYSVALALVNPALASVPAVYTLAVYNLGGDNLINYAPDQPGQTYFQDARKSFGLTTFSPGVAASASDGGTSVGLVTPEFMKTLTLANLQQLKTPWGRQYLAFAQAYGTIWGLS